MRAKITALVASVAAAVGAASAARWARGRKDEDELELEVGSDTGASEGASASASPAPAAAPASAAVSAPAVAPGETLDDLTAIKGLGKVKAAKLVAAGVTSYAQIAAWNDDDIAAMGLECNTSPGQIKREDWVGQAKVLGEG